MYTFDDAGGRSLTLRPEGTAPVCRAYLEHGMHTLAQPVKLWYLSSFFRQEKPQAGRFRQFWQVGAEAIGSDDPAVDAESIVLLHALLEELGVRGVRLRLGQPGLARAPRRLPRAAAGPPARARGRAVGGRPRPHRPQPAARLRLRPPGHARRRGRRAAAARPPRARGRRALRHRPRAARRRRRAATRSTRRSCAAWTTTRARSSSSPPTRSAPSPASAAAGATTG